MPRTYHVMGWNRDRDEAGRPRIPPLELTQCIDEVRALSPAVWDAMTDLMAFGTGVVRAGAIPRDAVIRTRVVRPEPMRETLRERRVRLWKRPMVTLKDDDPQITWDDKAMAARPFRARKD